jgi:hypothetical protein
MPSYRKGTLGYKYTKRGCKRSNNGRWTCPKRTKGGSRYLKREGRCPKDTYVKRFGRSAGWCVGDKEKANRVPCSYMTRLGRKRSKRCREKSEREKTYV